MVLVKVMAHLFDLKVCSRGNFFRLIFWFEVVLVAVFMVLVKVMADLFRDNFFRLIFWFEVVLVAIFMVLVKVMADLFRSKACLD